MGTLDGVIRDLVVANRVLANEGVLDAYGHVSVRHPSDPKRYLISCSRSPQWVDAEDILEYSLEGDALSRKGETPYTERHIHGAIYEARPDVLAVVHSHADEVLPFSVSSAPLRAVIHTASGMGARLPVWDIADRFGPTDLLVSNMQHGRDLAKSLADGRVVLMRGHGFSAVGRTLKEVVKNLFHLRFQSATERLETPSEIRKARREVARIMTVQRERQLAAQQPAAKGA